MNCLSQRQLARLALNSTENAELTAHLKQCPTCRSSLETMRSLRNQLAEAHAKFGEGHEIAREQLLTLLQPVDPSPEPARPRERFSHWMTTLTIRRRIAAVASVAAAAVLGFLLFLLPQAWYSSESMAWANVVDSLMKKPWLHYVTTYGDGTRMEAWFSARRALLIARVIKAGATLQSRGDGEARLMVDLSQNTRDWYDPEKNVIVRTTDRPFEKGADPAEAIFSTFLSGNLAHTIDAGQFQLVPTEHRVVVEGKKHWIEYRLIQRGKNDNPIYQHEWIISVDPDTQLPFRWEQVARLVSDPSKFDVGARHEIDYPAAGPEDIYALGVPKSAKIVDRTLRSDVERLAKEAAAPRHWADDKFSALVIESGVEKHLWWQGYSIYRVWKDGLCWRWDHSMGPVTDPLDNPPPAKHRPGGVVATKGKKVSLQTRVAM